MISMLGIDLAGRDVLAVGGGVVALRRAQAWADGGAHLRVFAPRVVDELAMLLERAGTWRARPVREGDLEGAWLVLAATDDPAVNHQVAAWAEARRTWCVVADAAEAGTAHTPATARSGDLTVGVVTDGRGDPRRMAAVRDALAERHMTGVDRRRRRLAGGRVTLVGGGPGAVDLLTVRGRRALAEADVVIADRLGPLDVLDELPPGVSVPALAGMPLTHRGTVAAFHVIAGHAGLDDVSLACVREGAATLVVLMGVSQLNRIATQALAAGADPMLPVALVENGSTPQQRVTRAPLREIVARAAQVGVRSPAVIVIGEVAAEHTGVTAAVA
ncbi:siroheme synthase [Pseudactinotalea terrae]|uniref:siroheme synthase family protein n=1 Tax=Pseudactinotalea terrae TaxID=1743262 RepID=UPI0012E26891|nr:NAD(P)-dependent oxidoreductase [Pseudactinotalea terrae]